MALSPVQFVHANTLVFNWDGKVFPPEEFGHRQFKSAVPADTFLMAVRVEDGHVSEEDLNNAKAFTQKYVVKGNEESLGHMLHTVDAKQLKKEIRNKYHVHDRSILEACTHDDDPGMFARRAVVESAVKNKLDQITPEKIDRDLVRNRNLKGVVTASNDLQLIRGQERESMKGFKNFPEWLQVLVGEHGAIIRTGNGKGLAYMGGLSLSNARGPNILTAYVNTFDNMFSEGAISHGLLEEMIHEMQKRTVNVDGFDIRRIMPPVKKLLDQMDADENHPALLLIKKTQPDGDSLMAKQNRHLLVNRLGELMVDIYDAEVYLRRVAGKTPEETKAELIEVFGKDVYSASRIFVDEWIIQASGIISNVVGADMAEELKAKWMEDPFCHTKFKANTRQAQQHQPDTGSDIAHR